MRNAAHRRQDEAPPEPPRDLAAEAAVLADQARALLSRMERAGVDMQARNEMIILGLRLSEHSAALEDRAAGQAVTEAAYAQGWRDRDTDLRASRPRHGARGGHLRSLPGIPATAARAAAAGIVVAAGLGGGLVAGMHDEAAVRVVAAVPARHAVLHRMAPDGAVVIPVPASSPPRPSAAAASASPAPAVTPAPASSSPPAPAPSVSPPPPPVTAPAGPVLVAPSLLGLGGSHFGQLPLSVDGPGEVAWTATATDGITLVPSAGVAVSGQPVELQVDDPTGDGGWVYFSAGSQAVAVHVVPFGASAVALP